MQYPFHKWEVVVLIVPPTFPRIPHTKLRQYRVCIYMINTTVQHVKQKSLLAIQKNLRLPKARVILSHGVVSLFLTFKIEFFFGMFYLFSINVVFCNIRYSSRLFETFLMSIWPSNFLYGWISLIFFLTNTFRHMFKEDFCTIVITNYAYSQTSPYLPETWCPCS